MTQSIFTPPYAGWNGATLLAHFQQRKTVTYFALRDAEQACPAKIAGILENCFSFNDETYTLPANFDWTQNPSPDREWLILLHKFYFAAGLGEEFCLTGERRYLDKWVELTEAWIDSVALDFLPSDVCGRRVQNWIFAHYFFVSQAKSPLLSGDFYSKFLASLCRQVNYLCENLTPARNHRTIELYAIFMAAVVFPEFKDAARWLEFSRQELCANIEADLLPDGVHCEMSTDYHHLVLRNYLNIVKLAHLNQIEMPPIIDERIQAALEFAKFVHKPDGSIPALSDGDSRNFIDVLRQGFYLYQDQELAYIVSQGRVGKVPATRSKLFANSGYAILRSGWGAGNDAFGDERYLIFDCGPLGAGNHGHLDLLSFEMAAYGKSLIVDPGRFTYHEPPADSVEPNWRVYFRGTAAHNTVQIDGKEQTRYVFHKNRFKIKGPEPEYQLTHFCSGKDRGHNSDRVQGVARSHEYPVVHERTIDFFCSDSLGNDSLRSDSFGADYWIVTDELRADEPHRYDLRFHLCEQALGKTTLEVVDGRFIIRSPHLLLIQPYDPAVEVTIEEGYLSRTYGVKLCAPVVRFSHTAANHSFRTILYPSKNETPCLPPLAVCPLNF